MLTPNLAEMLVLIGTVGVIAAVVVYFYVRLVRWAPRQEKSLEYVRKHALWTGAIAWALSSLAGAANAGVYPADRFDAANNPWGVISLFPIFAPVLAVLAVHAIGQMTWPAPKAAKRVAVLEFRRVRDYVEPALGWTVLGIFALTAIAVGVLFFAPGFDAPAPPATDGGGNISLNGRVPGYVLATTLGTALLVLSIGTWAVMRLVASRRSLEHLDHEQNTTLRVIGMNRLLRVSATVASGLVFAAGNFMAQPAPGSLATSWTNWLGLTNIVVLIAMLLWKPPFLDAEAPDSAYNTLFGNKPSQSLAHDDGPAAARLVDSGTPAVVMAALVGALIGALLISWLGGLGPMIVGIVFILLAYAGLEILLRRNYATPGTPRARLEKVLPWAMYAALAIAVVGLGTALGLAQRAATVGVGTSEGWNGQGGPSSFVMVPLGCSLLIAAIGALAALLVIRRPGLNNASPELDSVLRRRSLFRIARTVAAGWFAILAALLLVVPYEANPNPLAMQPNLPIFGALCIVLAALLLIFPVRAFTPNQFVSRGRAALPGATNSQR